jgi:hypothetical protein
MVINVDQASRPPTARGRPPSGLTVIARTELGTIEDTRDHAFATWSKITRERNGTP